METLSPRKRLRAKILVCGGCSCQLFIYLFCKYYCTFLIDTLTVWADKYRLNHRLFLFTKTILALTGLGLIISIFSPEWYGFSGPFVGLGLKHQCMIISIMFFGIFLLLPIFNVRIVSKGKSLIILLAMITSLGMFRETMSQWLMMRANLNYAHSVKMNSIQNDLRNLARKNEPVYHPIFDIETLYKVPYRYGDKFIRGIHIERMHTANSQALKKPRNNWFL